MRSRTEKLLRGIWIEGECLFVPTCPAAPRFAIVMNQVQEIRRINEAEAKVEAAKAAAIKANLGAPWGIMVKLGFVTTF